MSRRISSEIGPGGSSPPLKRATYSGRNPAPPTSALSSTRYLGTEWSQATKMRRRVGGVAIGRYLREWEVDPIFPATG